jgi:hypothetical protein
MDLSQGIYGGFKPTLIVTIIIVIMMAQLAFHYEQQFAQFKYINDSHGKLQIYSDEAVNL